LNLDVAASTMTDDFNHDHEPTRRSSGVLALRLAGTIVFLMAAAWFVRFALLVKEDAPGTAVYFLSLPVCGFAVVAGTGIYRRSAMARQPACDVERKQAELLFGVAAVLVMIAFFYESVSGHVP
jgi:hypothetical protein